MCRCYENDLRSASEEMSTLEYLFKYHRERGDDVTADAIDRALFRCWQYHSPILGEEVFYTLKYYSNPIREEKRKAYWNIFSKVELTTRDSSFVVSEK